MTDQPQTIVLPALVDETNVLFDVPLHTIVPSRWQPRQSFDPEALLELAQHVRDHGLMYPVILFVNEDGEHELVAGERRTRATVALALIQAPTWTAEQSTSLQKAVEWLAAHNWTRLPENVQYDIRNATITARIEPGHDHRRLHELAVADNIQRSNLTPMEEANALHDLMFELGISQRELAGRIGWSHSKLQERLSLIALAPEAQQALAARAVSTSHVRHIARCPADIQPAVTAYVTQLIDKEGDQAATVKQIAVLTQQVRAFLEPGRWLPPADEIVPPANRNRLRLMHHLVTHVDQAARGDAILGLRKSDDYSRTNVLGKKAASLTDGGYGLDLAVKALTGTGKHLDETWVEYAHLEGWTCPHCRLAGLAAPDPHGEQLPCSQWRAGGTAENTCMNWIGPADPLVFEASHSLRSRVASLGLPGLWKEPYPHFTDYEAWRSAVEQAARADAVAGQEAQQKRDTAHIRDLAAYWAQQQPGGLFAAVTHFQAHRCDRCLNYRPELLAQGLPPCDFAVNPLPGRSGNTGSAPDFGLLIRRDGLMLPRCAHYRVELEHLDIRPMRGFVFPDRAIVLDWAHRIAVGNQNNTHDSTLCGPLLWLPYPRHQVDDLHDLDRLLRYLRQRWDALGDECVATLVSTLASETTARARWQNPVDLLDPTTLQVETWASKDWDEAIAGKTRYYGHNYPKDFPCPWETTPDLSGFPQPDRSSPLDVTQQEVP